jgi:hypothetical protein
MALSEQTQRLQAARLAPLLARSAWLESTVEARHRTPGLAKSARALR